METFLRQTGWYPPLTAAFGGALRYSKYGMLKKLVMRLIAAKVGDDTDTARDHEYTDWESVTRFAEAFARQLPRV